MMFMKNTNTCLTAVNSNQKNFDPTNKKVISKMKDECKGVPIDEFDALKSKI